VAGEWKSGDSSQQSYQRIPVGLADRVVQGEKKIDLLQYARVVHDHLSTFDPDAASNEITAGSWEFIVKMTYIRHLSASAHYIAQRVEAVKLLKDPQHQFEILHVALVLYKRLFDILDNQISSVSGLTLDKTIWRNAGIVSAMINSMESKDLNLSDSCKGKQRSDEDVVDLMFRFWGRFISDCLLETKVNKTTDVASEDECKTVAYFVQQRLNPFTNAQFLDPIYHWIDDLYGAAARSLLEGNTKDWSSFVENKRDSGNIESSCKF